MKKLLFIGIAVISLVSCNNSNNNGKFEGASSNVTIRNNIKEFSYNGHSYIYFVDNYRGGVVHNPDCPCSK